MMRALACALMLFCGGVMGLAHVRPFMNFVGILPERRLK